MSKLDGMKQCSKCKEFKPATKEYFYLDSQCLDGLRSDCKRCRIEKQLVYQQKNNNKYREYQQKYRLENQERHIKYCQEYYIKHKEETLKNSKEYAQKHSEEKRAYIQNWRKNNKDKTSIYHRNRAARKRNAEGTHTAEDAQEIWEAQKGRCLYCNIDIDRDVELLNNNKAHLDHFIPLKLGGRNDKENLVWSCRVCNESKHDRLPWNWDLWNGNPPIFWKLRLI